MKIAVLSDGIYPFVIGGMQKHSYYLVKYLLRNRIEVDLYHYILKRNLSIEKVFSKEERKYLRVYEIKFPRYPRFPGHYLLASFVYSKRISRKLKRNDPVDFIYAKGFTGWHVLIEKSKKGGFPKLGVNFHGLNMFQGSRSFSFSKLLFRPVVKYCLQRADVVFSYGGKITEILLKIGIDPKNIIEVPAGIENDWVFLAERKRETVRSFIYVGRYERLKGVEEIHRVIPALSHEFEFMFVGDVPDRLKISLNNVHYLGAINSEEKLKEVLRKGDILVCPSYSEGMRNVILEAMASGLAVIATDVGAISELVDRDNGWLIEAGNVLKLEEAMKEGIHIPEMRLLQMKEASIKRIREKFLWDDLVGNLVSSIKKAIK